MSANDMNCAWCGKDSRRLRGGFCDHCAGLALELLGDGLRKRKERFFSRHRIIAWLICLIALVWTFFVMRALVILSILVEAGLL